MNPPREEEVDNILLIWHGEGQLIIFHLPNFSKFSNSHSVKNIHKEFNIILTSMLKYEHLLLKISNNNKI